MKKGSEYGTEIMSKEDCLLFAEVAICNGSDIKETVEDMRMIDNLLMAQRMYLLSAKAVQRTRSGHLRKGHTLLGLYDRIIDGRVNNQ